MNGADGNLVAVAMSGGVDSSVAAALLHTAGTPVVGLTMQLWNQRRLAGAPGMPEKRSGRCCSLDDVYDARHVAEKLGIPYYVVNYEENFEREVVRRFVEEYRAGRTPVPCTQCNTAVKFERLLATAQQIGAANIATGHYARVRHNPATASYELLRAVDESKDQTFFLWELTQEQLSRALFPLGALRKPEVRLKAAELGLAVADKPDSNEICFVPGNDYGAFLAAYAAEQGEEIREQPGEMVTAAGEKLAVHPGVSHFTVGQRKGLGLATIGLKTAANPLYVLHVDSSTRQVTVGEESELFARELQAGSAHWISGTTPTGALRVKARIRSRHQPADAWAEPLPDRGLRVTFDEPQRAITPGQSVVLYDGEVVLGGGWIARRS